MAVSIVCSYEPFAVPAVLKNCVIHLLNFVSCAGGFSVIPKLFTKLSVFFTVLNEHSCNKYGLRNRSFGRSESLEGFTRMLREAVKVQAVIPVGTSDERKIVGTFVVNYVIEGSLKMLHKCSSNTHVIIIRNHFL